LDNSALDIVKDQLSSYVQGEVIKATLFSSLYAAIALPKFVLSFSDVLDHPFRLSMDRALHAASVLADVIEQRALSGGRPVTLVGYSMGARVIFAALQYVLFCLLVMSSTHTDIVLVTCRELADRRIARRHRKQPTSSSNTAPTPIPLSHSDLSSSDMFTPDERIDAAPMSGVRTAGSGPGPSGSDLDASPPSTATPFDTKRSDLLPATPSTASASLPADSTAPGEDSSDSLICDVLLAGAPVTASASVWAHVRPLIAGRFINVYSTKDWTLRLMYRSLECAWSVAGLQPIDCAGVESVDASAVVTAHHLYGVKMKDVLQLCSFQP
jgi:hypothetical protein